MIRRTCATGASPSNVNVFSCNNNVRYSTQSLKFVESLDPRSGDNSSKMEGFSKIILGRGNTVDKQAQEILKNVSLKLLAGG